MTAKKASGLKIYLEKRKLKYRKARWKPLSNDKYFRISLTNGNYYVTEDINLETNNDTFNIILGNCFETHKEATKRLNAIKRILKARTI